MKYEASVDDDLEYSFHLWKIENSFWDWFIKSFKWMLEDKEIVKDVDIMNLDESSTIKYNFKSYGKQTVKVIVTNSVKIGRT